MKTQIFFVLIPSVDKGDHFGGMLILDREKLSEQMAKECGGSIDRHEIYLN